MEEGILDFVLNSSLPPFLLPTTTVDETTRSEDMVLVIVKGRTCEVTCYNGASLFAISVARASFSVMGG